MPILHTQYRGEVRDQEGKTINIHPRVILKGRGPILQVTLGFPESIAGVLIEQGKPVPSPVSGYALVDTGASDTCIDSDIAETFNLPVIDQVKMASDSHNAIDKNVYPALIEFVSYPIKINVERAVGANLMSQDLLVLLGRDLLQSFTLFYNGPAGELTLSY